MGSDILFSYPGPDQGWLSQPCPHCAAGIATRMGGRRCVVRPVGRWAFRWCRSRRALWGPPALHHALPTERLQSHWKRSEPGEFEPIEWPQPLQIARLGKVCREGGCAITSGQGGVCAVRRRDTPVFFFSFFASPPGLGILHGHHQPNGVLPSSPTLWGICDEHSSDMQTVGQGPAGGKGANENECDRDIHKVSTKSHLMGFRGWTPIDAASLLQTRSPANTTHREREREREPAEPAMSAALFVA
ncbi:hypothetical protein B0H67DRAFT_347477 [Lasiosphaeris hirsuta]|uniref:Uncharacterized protein n=1 Tax=Lasiosphaeris hirsuta TaxID=260670 RepID=A0AA39ZV88_9PEZI|nr:hypothetical protein B0H67DRAFT_347477 [Lasiosphaeris hirsuta]